MSKSLWVVLLGLIVSSTSSASTSPLEALKQSSPALYALHQSYPTLHKVFSDYAVKQGFRGPVEGLATVVHELIHVDSASHQGFYVNGIYYEPYLRRDAWPSLTNEKVRPYLLDQERRGPIYQLYALNTPNNHLGNLVDEINAYGHVLPFVCRNEPESTQKQVTNLIGFLNLTEGYLRTLRTGLPNEFERFAANREARGAFSMVMQRAWTALRECGVPDGMIPAQEAGNFISWPKK